MLSTGGFSAYQMASGREGDNEDLFSAQDALLAGQCAQQRKLRMRAQDAPLEEVANSNLRRLLANNK